MNLWRHPEDQSAGCAQAELGQLRHTYHRGLYATGTGPRLHTGLGKVTRMNLEIVSHFHVLGHPPDN